jgi:hypothetical protein
MPQLYQANDASVAARASPVLARRSLAVVRYQAEPGNEEMSLTNVAAENANHFRDPEQCHQNLVAIRAR